MVMRRHDGTGWKDWRSGIEMVYENTSISITVSSNPTRKYIGTETFETVGFSIGDVALVTFEGQIAYHKNENASRECRLQLFSNSSVSRSNINYTRNVGNNYTTPAMGSTIVLVTSYFQDAPFGELYTSSQYALNRSATLTGVLRAYRLPSFITVPDTDY